MSVASQTQKEMQKLFQILSLVTCIFKEIFFNPWKYNNLKVI
jgi:hypothetical protein